MSGYHMFVKADRLSGPWEIKAFNRDENAGGIFSSYSDFWLMV
jgi:hypothetical protein